MLLGTQQVNEAGHLTIGGCDTVALATTYGTPLYVIDEAHVRACCATYRETLKTLVPFSSVVYAGKAFLTIAMCQLIASEGLVLDVASGGELYTAIQASFPADRILFHGNYKSAEELNMAIDYGVGWIVVDNLSELDTLAAIAEEKGKKPSIFFRVTPGIDPKTHRRIRTGQEDTKFGLSIKGGQALTAIQRAIAHSHIDLVGLHCHVGSNLQDASSHLEALEVLGDFLVHVQDQTGWYPAEFNIGGGLGVRYSPEDAPLAIPDFLRQLVAGYQAMRDRHHLPEMRLWLEPGRSIVAEAGITLYRIGPVKPIQLEERTNHYVMIDGGMGDNPRPQLYDARYTALVANRADQPADFTATIAGRHCETDLLIQDAAIAQPQSRDILAVQTTGAYNYSMASQYNRYPRPPVIFVRDGRSHVVVERETYADVLRQDRPLLVKETSQ